MASIASELSRASVPALLYNASGKDFMAIDNPLDAAESRIAAERRSDSPVTRFIGPIASLFDSCSALVPTSLNGPNLAFGTIGLKLAGSFIAKTEEGRLKYLIENLAMEFRRMGSRLDEIVQSHEQFVEEEFLPLVLDGLQKAEQTRDKKRIERIAAILAHSLEVGPAETADTAEEMMRVAVVLSDEEVVVLRCIYKGQFPKFNKFIGRVDNAASNDFWALLLGPANPAIEPLRNISQGKIQGICSKLQSLGLVAQDERNQMKIPPAAMPPYGLLAKGVTFVEYIRSK
jgi:hypothetical protein